MRRIRPSHVLFAASALLLLTVLGSFLTDAALRPSSTPHPDYESLDRTATGSSATLGWGYLMGLGVLATIGAAVVMGVRKQGRSGALGRWLAAGFVVLAAIFTALVWSYTRYASGTGTELFLGLPGPTAWMLYGVWLFPFAMIVACVWHFEWFVTDEDQRKFEEMVAKTKEGTRGI